ncbi:hypothetical protein [Hanstruepera neustonica]|nr:hypothetical protein [Hanstruepera neustonica]
MNNNKKPFDIRVEGSLGILAYGDIGLREWRKVKKNDKNRDEIDEEE